MSNLKDINDRIKNGEFHPYNFDGDTDVAKCLAARVVFRTALEQEFADTTWSDETLDTLWDVVFLEPEPHKGGGSRVDGN